MLIKKNKTVTYLITNAYITSSRDTIIIKSDSEIKEIKNSEIPIMDLASNGSSIDKGHVDKFDLKYNLKHCIVEVIKKEEVKKEVEKQVSFEEVKQLVEEYREAISNNDTEKIKLYKYGFSTKIFSRRICLL